MLKSAVKGELDKGFALGGSVSMNCDLQGSSSSEGQGCRICQVREADRNNVVLSHIECHTQFTCAVGIDLHEAVSILSNSSSHGHATETLILPCVC